jgi:hypothetical protein
MPASFVQSAVIAELHDDAPAPHLAYVLESTSQNPASADGLPPPVVVLEHAAKVPKTRAVATNTDDKRMTICEAS